MPDHDPTPEKPTPEKSGPEKPGDARRAARNARARARRAALRAQGLRPVTLWVPDTRTEAFKAEAARQSALVASREEADIQDFLDAANAALFASLPEEPDDWFDAPKG